MKLSNLPFNKLKSGLRNGNEVIVNIPSNIDDSND